MKSYNGQGILSLIHPPSLLGSGESLGGYGQWQLTQIRFLQRPNHVRHLHWCHVTTSVTVK